MEERQTTEAGKQVTPELVKALTVAFNDHDVDAIMEFFADDCEWIMARGPEQPHGRRCVGKEEIREALSARFAVIPDMRWVDDSYWVLGDRAFSEWTVQGTTASGERMNQLGCDHMVYRNGKIMKKDTYWKYIE